ncbi:hypothetical protein NKDENANG_01953 [Candidatus Entotheonellaceae bacterium PAL068K]
MAAITPESVITRIVRHLKLASVPPPIAPARCRQELFAFNEAHASSGPMGDVRATTAYLIPLRLDIRFEIPPSFSGAAVPKLSTPESL